MRIIDVTAENVEETGFFCLMSRRKSEGWKRKLEWLRARFDEGLRIKILDLSEGGRGFIEYIPGEYAWRPVEASGYFFVHCLWVVGKSKGNGYAKLLLEECLADAKASGAQGIAMVTSEGNWLVGKKLLLSRGFAATLRLGRSLALPFLARPPISRSPSHFSPAFPFLARYGYLHYSSLFGRKNTAQYDK